MSLLDEAEYQAVKARYIDNLSWFKVSQRIYFSDRWSKKLAQRGLEKVARALFGVDKSIEDYMVS
ncbi:hypothetical protein IMX26_13140 [Clostridium sp. 'deep sea']|uniref:hypothetical protein n=1 Tax=Clostridium sp. 'deep sea' TaxID=2779445 RepID=UPI0018966F09|nr:hypothetical protein [Clostridium sp. 'deep sea']QOR34428.1 hypothetical protein IMX26_13140 [Clostridium sp. 'deep sea']